MAGVVNASATLSMHVAGFGFGNVLPQYKWMCKTSGGEFNPSGYCLVGRTASRVSRLSLHPCVQYEVVGGNGCMVSE